MNLLQNCDLPPPLKVFPGSMVRVSGLVVQDDEATEEGKLGLLKALRLSQTRAREAERRAAQLEAERDRISDFLLRESMQLSAYRQWVRLLEMQVSKLQMQRRHKERELDGGQNGDGISWVLALAICIGIAGVGFSFGCRYLF